MLTYSIPKMKVPSKSPLSQPYFLQRIHEILPISGYELKTLEILSRSNQHSGPAKNRTWL